jgi:xanthine dehydrogenase YagS FAD-binding subunit
MLPKFSHVKPGSLRQTLAVLETKNARIHAGGTDLIGCLRDGVFTTETLVSLGNLTELRGITTSAGGGLTVGAMTSIADIAANPAIRDHSTALADAAGVVASPQLRNQGTLGGNLCQKPRCWYYRGDFHCLRKGGELCYAFEGENQYHCIFGGETCFIVHPSDTAPALAALGAVATVAGPAGRRKIPVEKLHVPPSVDPQREIALEPDEVLLEVSIPPPAAGLRSSYRKIRARASWDFALAGVALAITFDHGTVTAARVVLSGVAPIPWRSRAVEKAIVGTELDDAVIKAAALAAVDGAEPLTHNGYKIELVKGLVADQLEAIRRG